MVQTGMLRGLGGRLRQVLRLALGDRIRAFASGLAVTALLQSSTATALMLAGFLDSGFVALPMALAAIFGANVGTTLIVQLLAFDISAIMPLLILIGVVVFKRSARTKLRDFGRVFIGLGLILLALRLMTEVLAPVEKSDALREVLSLLTRDPIFDILAAALLTWAAHSSVATVLLVMSMASAGWRSYSAPILATRSRSSSPRKVIPRPSNSPSATLPCEHWDVYLFPTSRPLKGRAASSGTSFEATRKRCKRPRPNSRYEKPTSGMTSCATMTPTPGMPSWPQQRLNGPTRPLRGDPCHTAGSR